MFPGRTIADRYRVLRVLGRGGMGVVSEAEELATGKHVAIKFLREDVESDMQPNARFLREAKLATRLKSPYACRVSEIGEWELGPYLVMELLEGRSLAAIIEDKVVITWQQAVRIASEMCDALAEAHQLGIVHRDVKPGNVFLARASNGTAITKMLDFGVAKIPGTVVTASGERSLTDAATLLGTPSYVAPEQLMNSKLVDARADIWAVGVLLYEMFAGRLPFSSPLVPKLLVMIARDEPAPLSTLSASLPEPLAQIVHRCLNKDRSRRYDDASTLAQALSPWVDPTPNLLGSLLLLQSKHISIEPTVPPPCDATQVTPPSRHSRDSLGPHTALNSDERRRRRKSRLRCITAGTCLGALAAVVYIAAATTPEASRTVPEIMTATAEPARPSHDCLVLVDPPRAEVRLDNVVVPGNPARLSYPDDGEVHRLTISAPGYVTETRMLRFNVAQQLSLSLRPMAVPSAQPDKPPPPRATTPRVPKGQSSSSADKASSVRRLDTDIQF